MSTERTAPTNRQVPAARPEPQRPPIQWPVRDAVSTADRERATTFARDRVERAYLHQEDSQPTPEPETQAAPEAKVESSEASEPVAQPAPQQVMRDAPYDWDKYHTAWQHYYHHYFYRYYANWWQQQRRQLTSQAKQEAAAQLQAQQPFTHSEPEVLDERQKVAKELRGKIRATAEKRAHKIKTSSHFKPAIAGLSVAALLLFFNYNQVVVGAIKQYVAPGNVVTTPVIVEPNTQAQIGPEPKIIIPKIGVDAPVVYDEPNVDEPSYQRALERGVVRLGTTADPGTRGNVVIGGHSSNNVFNAGDFKYVFVNLKQLDAGDIFYLHYQGVRYTYKITVAKKIIAPTDTSVLAQTDKPTVTLFTCDPPGTNINRLIVQAEQIDPSPSGATANTKATTPVNEANPLPSVAPSIWDRIFRRSN